VKSAAKTTISRWSAARSSVEENDNTTDPQFPNDVFINILYSNILSLDLGLETAGVCLWTSILHNCKMAEAYYKYQNQI